MQSIGTLYTYSRLRGTTHTTHLTSININVAIAYVQHMHHICEVYAYTKPLTEDKMAAALKGSKVLVYAKHIVYISLTY
jgi:hypothetical protein